MSLKLNSFILSLLFFTVACKPVKSTSSKTIAVDSSWQIVVDAQCDVLINWAARELASDLENILGSKIVVSNTLPSIKERCIIIENPQSNSNKLLKDKWEHFQITSERELISIAGSDVRGTVYGIFELAERMGISPWVWWADVVPDKRQKIELVIPGNGISESPSVQYRGIFLNDEDWGLHPWAAKTFEPEVGDIGPKTYEKIFQLLLRLKANTIWPAMHPCTKAFYQVPGNNEMAKKYHIVVGTSHCEPMLRNNVDEWDHNENGDYNYFTNKAGVTQYWSDRITQVNDAENIVTLGMRGIHDGHMHGGNTLEEKCQMLEQIIDDQRQMLVDIKKKPIDSIATTVVLYKEVLDLYNKGLQIPDDVTIMWCDDNHGFIRRLNDEEEQKRSGGSGIYYHLSYWGKPHDYLWLSTIQPGLIWYEMNRAYQNGARKMWIVNVGDIKPAEYNMELFLDMAWDINSVSEKTINQHMTNWAAREFGAKVAEPLADAMAEYYRLAAERRPEFMGWSGVEPITKTKDTEYNPNANGNELQRRLDQYQQLVDNIDALEKNISDHKKDAWFQLVSYPIKGAQLMNAKFLYAQLARHATTSDKRNSYIISSKQAYSQIEELTRQYNTEIANGKWNHMMSMAPRDLNVFKLPDFTPVESDAKKVTNNQGPIVGLSANAYTQCQGHDGYQWTSVEQLGRSNEAVTLMPLTNTYFKTQQPWLEYQFELPEGEYQVQVRCLPTHVNNRDQQLTLSFNGQAAKTIEISTKGRSKAWKENIFRNQVIASLPVKNNADGKHTLRLAVNQTGIVIDQIAIVRNSDLEFYTVP